MNLRLLGAPTLKDVVPAMVDASNIHNHSVAVPDDRLYQQNCTLTCHIQDHSPFIHSLSVDESMQHVALKGLKTKL